MPKKPNTRPPRRPHTPEAPPPALPAELAGLLAQEHQLRALLYYMTNAKPDCPRDFSEHLATARHVLSAPNPFDEYIGTPSIHEGIINAKGLRYANGDSPYDREHNRILAALRTRGNGDDLTAPAEYVQDIMYLVIEDAAVVGAILMYEMLKGGAR